MLCFQDCQFTKIKDNTTLHVVFQGNIHLENCGSCSKRWFITFNGAECSGPLPIDAALWIKNRNTEDYRPGAIEGYCENIRKGNIRVRLALASTLETVPVMETLMVTRDGCQCLVWLSKKFLAPSNNESIASQQHLLLRSDRRERAAT